MVHTILKFLVAADSEHSAQLQPAKPVCAAYCCHISFPVWVKAPSPQLCWTYCHWPLSRARLCWLAGTGCVSSTIGLLFAAGPTPARLWNGVEQWRKRGSKFCEYFWPRYVPPAFRVWMSTSVFVLECVNLFHDTSWAHSYALQCATVGKR